MSQKLTLEEIRDFWRRQAAQHGQSPTVSWSDRRVIEMEIRALVRRLADGDRVLDVGCANGYSTVQLASQRAIDIRGLDYLPEMIEYARASLQSLSSPIPGKVDFGVGSIMAIPEPSSTYDKVISIRVVTNLGEWSNQRIALCECARVLKPGGEIVLMNRVGADSGARRFLEHWLAPAAHRLGWRSDFPWERLESWAARAPHNIRLVERQPMPPFGHFSLIRFRKLAAEGDRSQVSSGDQTDTQCLVAN